MLFHSSCSLPPFPRRPAPWRKGPPFQVDDPVPVDFKHYEFYIFGVTDGTPIETDYSGPAFEFNWGAVPRVQLHAVLPWGGINPSDDPLPTAFSTWSSAPRSPSSRRVQNGSPDRHLHHDRGSQPAIPIRVWELEKPGTSFRSGCRRTSANGCSTAAQERRWYRRPDFHDFPYGGLLVKREVNKKLDLAAEIFAHGGEGAAPPQRLHPPCSMPADTGTSKARKPCSFSSPMATPSLA